jgi:hypothetical protein
MFLLLFLTGSVVSHEVDGNGLEAQVADDAQDADALGRPRNRTIPSHRDHTILPNPKTAVPGTPIAGIADKRPTAPTNAPK